jgi:thiamine biosynthesis lipoprotein ApbE
VLVVSKMYTELLTKDAGLPVPKAGTTIICENAFGADAVCTGWEHQDE